MNLNLNTLVLIAERQSVISDRARSTRDPGYPYNKYRDLYRSMGGKGKENPWMGAGKWDLLKLRILSTRTKRGPKSLYLCCVTVIIMRAPLRTLDEEP